MIAVAAIAVPLAGALLCLAPRFARLAAAAASAGVFGLAIAALELRPAGIRFLYAPSLASSFVVALDPLAALLLACCAAVTCAAIVASARVPDGRAYFALCSLALASAATVLAARDLAILFVGWESLVIAVAVLVRHWGGEGRRDASSRLVVHGLAGSGLFLVALASIAEARGTLDIDALATRPIAGPGQLAPALLFLAAFAPALAIFPLHGGVIRAFAAAPPAVAALIPGVLATAAAYAIVRVCLGLFPEGMAAAAPVLVAFGAVGALYAGIVATRQDDMRRGIAFAAMSQQSIAAVALFVGTPQSVRGAALLILANGLAVTAALLAAAAVARRTSSFLLSRAGGLRQSAPWLATLASLAAFGAVGVPGAAGFPGALLALAAVYERHPGVAAVGALALVADAAWAAWFVRRALDGPPLAVASRDAGWREQAAIVPLLVALLILGVAPGMVTDRLTDDVLPAVEVAP